MLGLSTAHLLLVLVIALIFFGPGKLPTLGKSLGEAIRGFKEGLDAPDAKDKMVKPAATYTEVKEPTEKKSDPA